MPRHIAFLRAINVGGHTVTMDDLRAAFESIGLANAETFIASGNVIFSSRSSDQQALARKIEVQLRKVLGYDVATVLRSEAELAALATFQSFAPAQVRAAAALNVGLLAQPLGAESLKSLMALRTEIDDFKANGREVYWLCKQKQSDSKFSGATFERKLETTVTFRNLRTLERLAAKYPAPSRGKKE